MVRFLSAVMPRIIKRSGVGERSLGYPLSPDITGK
jgi:hypothetical protein